MTEVNCPYCKSEDYGKVHGSDEHHCNDCGIAFDDKHVELQTENKRLREALEEIHKQSFKKRYWDIRDITYEELEKEWHEAVERNVTYCSVLHDIIENYKCSDSSDEKIKHVLNEVSK